MDDTETVRCEVLGGFRIYASSGAEVPFPVLKGAAIIGYLLLQNGRSTTRGELTGLLWGDRPEAAARTALRQCLHQMRIRLADIEPPFLSVTSSSISLLPGVVSSDIACIVGETPLLPTSPPGEIDPENFLRGFEHLDPAFSEWLWRARVQLGDSFRARLKSLLADPASAEQDRLLAAAHLHALDPSLEIAARPLIERSIYDGDMVALLRVYHKLCQSLDEEWDEEPSGDLQQLVGHARAEFGDVSGGDTLSFTGVPVRKYLTILSLCARQTPEPVQEVADGLKLAIRAITTRGGTIIDSSRAAVCAAFGLGTSSENSARDGVEVALELIILLNGDSQFGIGLDAGYLLLEPSADGSGFERIEGTPITQSRMLAGLGHGASLVATSRTLHGLEDYYLVTPEPAAAAPSVRIDGRKSVPQTGRLTDRHTVFIGRAPFLAALWEVWTESQESESVQTVSVQGAAGVGKTRLVDEFLKRVEEKGGCTLRAVCNRYDRSAPLEPLALMLRAFESRFGCEISTEAPPGSGDRTSIDGLVGALSRALKGRSVAILLDDWQWADDATRQAVGRIVASSGGFRSLLLVLTSRDAPVDEALVAGAQQILLPSLTAREVVEKAEVSLNRPIDSRLKQQLLIKSGGNPLFLEELCHALRHSEVGHNNDGPISELPANVQMLFASRFERLAEEDLAIVFATSVHGDQVETGLLSRVLGRPVPAGVLQRLSTHDVLSAPPSGQTLRFKHGLARDVAYSMIPEDRRRSLHLAYAECLRDSVDRDEINSIAEPLAFHYRCAGVTARAADFAELSGNKALKASSHDQAIRHFGQALDLLDQSPMDEDTQRRWISIALRWAIPMTYTPAYEQLHLLERAEQMARRIGDGHSAAAIRYWIGYFGYVLGEKVKPLEDLRRARQLAVKAEDRRLAIEAEAIESCLLASTARYDQAEPKMRNTLRSKESNPSKKKRVPVTSVYIRANLALLRADLGHFDEAQDLINQALDRVRGFEHEVESSILLFAGAINIWRGNWAGAVEDAQRARERSDKVSSPYLMGMSRCIWGYAHWRLSRSTIGLDTLARYARYMQDRGLGMYSTFTFGWLADAMAENGRWQEASAASRAAMERASHGELVGAAMACRASARQAIGQGRLEDADVCLARAAAFAERRSAQHEVAANHLMQARLSHVRGQQDVALRHTQTAVTLLEELGLEHRVAMARQLETELSPDAA